MSRVVGGDALIEAAMEGDRRALARLLSRIEAGGDAAEAALDAIHPRTGRAQVVGVTGAPGTGKSTLVTQLASVLRKSEQRLAIVAVDPSSPFTGGALLGDRVRMGALSGDAGVFVRSMASRGAGGGLAEQTAATCAVLDAAGFQTVIVETVGVGQDELSIAQEAHTTVVVCAPGLGDDVQALKSGILEIADVLVVNKADRDGADRLVSELSFGRGRSTAHLEGNTDAWETPILKTVATTGEGVPALADALTRHREWAQRSGAARARAVQMAERQVLLAAAAGAVRRARERARRRNSWDELVTRVAQRELSPQAAARRLLDTPAPGE